VREPQNKRMKLTWASPSRARGEVGSVALGQGAPERRPGPRSLSAVFGRPGGLMGSDAQHESGVVKAFVTPSKQERVLELLSKPKRRRAVLDTLYHNAPLDSRYMSRIASSDQSAGQIEALLRSKGAPDMCYAIWTDSSLDGSSVLLREALERIVGQGQGTILSCVPGQLAYFEAEDGGERCLLERPGGRTRR
jgi:hypothetical protein